MPSPRWCASSSTPGAPGREDALIRDTLTWLAESSPRLPAYLHQLGILAQNRGDYEEAERRYRQSLEINERLGNQAGIATGYHQLGRLAQLRGDYEEAERRYRQSLEIKERLGNQAGMAISLSQLGFLAGQLGKPEESVAFHAQALVIRLRLQVPQVLIDARALARHQEELGEEGLTKALTDLVGPEAATRILVLLDSLPPSPPEEATS